MNYERPVHSICGENPIFPAGRVGCGGPIYTCAEVYRCTDCDTPFHKECAIRHFGDHVPHKPVDGLPTTDAGGEPSAEPSVK